MQRIKDSLPAKVFLWVLCALAICSLLIYGLVMVILPEQYTALANSRTSDHIKQLTAELNALDTDSASKKILDFCIENHVSALLKTGKETLSFGDNQHVKNSYTFTASIRLSDKDKDSILTIIASAAAAGEITYTFLKILPAVAFLILLISSFSAWFCSRAIVRPVLKISGVSKRMALMDMTWHCDVNRTDELGVLAGSLNILSERLTQAMGKLEAANEQLKKEVQATQALEKQRRDFFAAASHELKTPITILKAQLESMALGIGEYRDHDRYFPQALAAVESMERLIKEILAVSKAEMGAAEASFTQELLSTVMEPCICDAVAMAKEKQMEVTITQEENICLHIHKPLFQKAVSNVLSNAVRYSPSGSILKIAWMEGKLTVENSGAAIAKEDLPLLFSPFYRVDKSRNRKSGGSGLGLYLVKTIIDLHGFGCEIENITDAVRFTVYFNQN